MRHTIRIDDLGHMRAGDMMPWRALPLRLTGDPEWTGECLEAKGTWGEYAVRVTQHDGDELMVWHSGRPRLTLVMDEDFRG